MRVRLRILPLALPLAALALAACGGSSHSSSSSAAVTHTSSSQQTVVVNTASSSSASASTTATTAATTTSTSTKDTNVRLPASFTIHAGGVLTPPSIAAPKHTDIQLSVTSADGKTHALTIAAPPHYYYLKVTPGSPARALLSELRDGHYTVTVDGAKRGLLIVGAAPGP